MSTGPDPDWPRREASRMVEAAGLRWHVQLSGTGPVTLLLHGTGSSTHTWAALAPRLETAFRLVAPDLPGHGFTAPRPARRMDSVGLADDVEALIDALDVRPALVVGHSAGAAIGLRLAARRGDVRGLVGLAPSLAAPWPGAPSVVGRVNRAIGASGAAARAAAVLAAAGGTGWILRSARSDVPADSAALYRRLASRPGHTAAALRMMSHWDAEAVEGLLPFVTTPCRFVAGGRDAWIPPDAVRAAVDRCPGAEFSALAGAGHLLHEERPADVATEIAAFARGCGLLPAVR